MAQPDDADIRTDLPLYKKYRRTPTGGVSFETTRDIREIWSDDAVTFFLGCSFSFEEELQKAGIPLRHVDEALNVSMFTTERDTVPSPPFEGKLVVSMRPIPDGEVERANEISGRFPKAHGSPVASGPREVLGIHRSLAEPDFGDPVRIEPGETPVYWACGVTSQVAVEGALAAELDPLPWAITHAPGQMFVCDLLARV